MLQPWGGGPEPADNEFMRRLFRHWDTEHQRVLTLPNLVNGFAQIKGTRDIMTNIAYFFDLYDDDADGKVDRDGILKMSEALLFLGRRGLSMEIRSPSLSPNLSEDREPVMTKDEQFLSSVSAFIRRCFEYADPDAVAGMATTKAPPAPPPPLEVTKGMEEFAIGDDDDEDEDLLDIGPSSPVKTRASRSNTLIKQGEAIKLPPVPSESKPNTHKANAALDPANPLFISLPTFRMVILADEILESFFDTGLANTFLLADQPIPSSASSLASFTTFANLGARSVGASAAAGVAAAGGAVLPPGKGLRGMLDSIVNDGMRVAGEVRRRMEEAQKELDRAGAGATQDESEEDEDDTDLGRAKSMDGRSILSTDHDLLGSAEVEAIDSNGLSGQKSPVPSLLDDDKSVKTLASGSSGEKTVEFER